VRVAPRADEPTIVTTYPNSFTGTELDSLLKPRPGDLPGTDGRVVEAAALQAASLASIADLFGIVVPDVRSVPD
jgi:hypothetical protein